MPIKRTVTKSKKDGVKKKTVTTSARRGSVTKTKAKGKKGKDKTTTVTVKKRTNSGFKDEMIATSSKQKSRATDYKGKVKAKNVLLSDGRMVSSKKGKGKDYFHRTDRTLGGVAGARTSSMGKYKGAKGLKKKGRSSGTGANQGYMYDGKMKNDNGVREDDYRRYYPGKDSSKRKVTRKGLRKRK